MSEKPKTMEVELFFHVSKLDDELEVFVHDMSDCEYYPRVLIGSKTVTVEVPTLSDNELVLAKIDQLSAAAEKIQAEAHVKVQNIKNQIQDLRAIEYKPEEGDK